MTLLPAGAQLGSPDLPPPHPASDPREPSPTAIRGRAAHTPQRTRSPAPGGYRSHSRNPSPSRPPVQHNAHTDPAVPIASPIPRPAGSLSAGSPIPPPLNPYHHSAPHLSRPSSPSSIHSSTSAIFERDIELPPVASLSINPNANTPTLSHKASRLSQFSHGSALDHTVPAVLDDAVEALTGAHVTSRGLEGLEIEAPAPAGGVSMARQSSASLHGGSTSRKASAGPGGAPRLGSRSPSPVSLGSRGSSGVISPAQSPPILGQLGSYQAQQAQASSGGNGNTSPTSLVGGIAAGGSRPAMAPRLSTGPQLPGGWAFGHTEKGQDGTPLEPATVTEEPTSSPSSPPAAAIPSHLTPSKDKRRISFISYNDLLLSVPTTVTPLEDITSGNLSPDHLPGTVSPNVTARSPVMGSSAPGLASKEVEHKPSWDAGVSGRVGGLGLGEGEWHREGLGRGLEQRLEDLARDDHPVAGSPPPLA